MSQNHPSNRRAFYRRALQVAGALTLIGAAAFAFGNPGSVAAKPGNGGNGLAPDVEAMKEAFERYTQVVEETAKLFVESDTFKLDNAHAVGAYDLISGFLHTSNRQSLTSSGSGQRGRPRFAGFDDPDTRIAAALEAYKSGKIEEAWSYLQEVAREMPDRLDVQGYLGLVRTQRAKRFAREIGDKARALRLTRSMGELKALNLRPDEGFLLSQIDGSVTIEELISLSSTDRVRTLETLARFLREGLVE